MGGVLRFLIAVILGGALGVGSALYVLKRGDSFGSLDVGGWKGSMSAGSTAADPYTRAIVAARGLLALASTEAVYFTRARADDGQPLREACVYRVSGGAMPGRWWSVTAYAPDAYLPQNQDEALSYDATRAGPGAWAVLVAPTRPAEGAWISSKAAGEGFSLTLRVYHPSAALQADPASLPAPRIETVSCTGAAG